MNHETRLATVLESSDWFQTLLHVVRSTGPPSAWIGAGAIRSLIWDHLHGRDSPPFVSDVDVVYFEPKELSSSRDREFERSLRRAMPRVLWEVTNQAAVHLWFEEEFGYPVEPLDSIQDAISTWPETATAVAVRRSDDGNGIDVLAPFGLADLMDIVVRRNPRRVTVAEYERRIASKYYASRWPKARIVRPG